MLTPLEAISLAHFRRLAEAADYMDLHTRKAVMLHIREPLAALERAKADPKRGVLPVAVMA